MDQTGRESGWVYRLRLWMMGAGSASDSLSFDGWPWYPGAAAWVGPTALSVLALKKLANRAGGPANRSDLKKRIDQGRASGSLTRKEADRLKAEQARNARAEERAKADGVVTMKERARLTARENRSSKHIARQKHDRQKVAPST